MSRKTLLIVAAFSLMMVGIVIDRFEPTGKQADERFYPGLESLLPEVRQVTLVAAGQETNLVRDGDIWQIAERDGYPADFEKLSQLLMGLAKAELKERKTALVSNHESLSVTEAEGTTITLSTRSEELSAVLGKTVSKGAGTFARYRSADQVWLLDQSLTGSANPADWLDNPLISLPQAEIESIEVAIKDEKIYRAVKQSEGDWGLERLPAGRKLRYSTVLTPLATAVSQLSIVDVARYDEARWDAPRAQVTYQLSEGKALLLSAVMANDQYWLRVVWQPGLSETAPDSDGGSRVSVPMRVSDFDYRISKRLFDDLSQSLASLLAEEQEE
jgi:hypothetical protein